MFVRVSATSRLRWTVKVWTILLSVTAAILVAVVGLHALTDDTIDTATAATIASTTSVLSAPASDTQDAPIPVAAEWAMSTVTDTGDASTCGLLALLCVAALAAILIRMRGGAALTVTAGGPTPPAPPVMAHLERQMFAGLTALSVARI
jgi:hypothetical protein